MEAAKEKGLSEGIATTEADHGIPGLILHSDNTLTRPPLPTLPPSPSSSSSVPSKDVHIRPPSVWARIFIPHAATTRLEKLPVLLFFHGGGFVFLSPSTSFYHRFCERLSARARAIVVSVNYRLAPEHRLPAAYEDARTALEWVQLQLSPSNSEIGESPRVSEPWLARHANPSRCFLMGDSAGGNIVHHLALHVAKVDLQPVKISGLILLQPFFGGIARTAQECSMAHDKVISIKTSDFLWKMALPKGADRDHPLCNPLPQLALIVEGVVLPKALLVIGGRDPMAERQLQYYDSLKSSGKDVKLVVYEEAPHAFPFFRPHPATERLFIELEMFMQSCISAKL